MGIFFSKNRGDDVAQQWTIDDNIIQIKLPEIFDFDVNLDYLTRDTNECMYEVDDKHITRLIEIDGERILMRVSALDNQYLTIEFLSGTKPEQLQPVVDYVWEWFDLGYDLEPFYTMAREDQLLSQVIDKAYGLRLMGINELFEALCWAILGQQINLTFAYTLKRRFVEAYGESMVYQGKRYMLFPSVETISNLTSNDMEALK